LLDSLLQEIFIRPDKRNKEFKLFLLFSSSFHLAVKGRLN